MPEQPNRLLVVDDDFASRTSLSRRLRSRGYEVETADSGPAALEKILSDHYDLILLDQRMPEMSGLDLLRLLRATHSKSELPVIMVTGVDDNASIVDALHEGANDYVIKPVEMPEITARIEAQLGNAERSREAESLTERHPESEAVWEWDPVSRVVRFSRMWQELRESAQQETGSGIDAWLDRVHPQDLLHVRAKLDVLLDGTSAEIRTEHRLRLSGGQYRWVACRATAVRDAEGGLVRIAGSLADIQQRKTLDPLTGLGNRQSLQDAMASALLAGAELRPGRWVLLMLDVDGFKAFIESFGNQAGDRLLIAVAERLKFAVALSRFAYGATLARSGDDEFTVVTRCSGGQPDASEFAEILLAAFANPFPAGPLASSDERQVPVTASIGVAVGDAAGVTLDQMLADAGVALNAARAEGTNHWDISAPDLRECARLRAATIRDFRHAVQQDQLVAFYQPQIDLVTRRLTGFEALMRWRHPVRGLLPPYDFISIAEETGMIAAAGEWILRDACRQLRLWQDQFPLNPPLTVSVNLSPRQLRDGNMLPQLRRILEETGIPPDTLHLEITESWFIDQKESASEMLAAIRKTGVHLDLDDFGTGYASLAYLKVVHFDALKIDRSFVSRMDSDEESFAIIKTILGLANELRMGVVAEGIETETQLRQLVDLGCKSGQGFYFAKPVDAYVAGEMLRVYSEVPAVAELIVA